MGDLTDENAALIAVLRSQDTKGWWTQIANRVKAAGSATAVFNTLTGTPDSRDDWAETQDGGLFPEPVDAQTKEHLESLLAQARTDLQSWDSQGLTFLSCLDPSFPDQLREVFDMPPFLFAQGTVVPREEGVSIVGSRKASAAGLDFATRTAQMLVDRGLTVIAGGAAGIDAAAHRAALEAGGRTVAFLGTGITRRYPAENARLQDAIATHGGALFSQFWPDQPPARWTFPQRNASMSGYGIASVIVEAGEYSGTRIQARQAQAHGRPIILHRTVADTTQWGHDLASQPGVFIAENVEDVARWIDKIQTDNQLIAQLAGQAQ